MIQLFFGNRSFSLLLLPVIIAGYYWCNSVFQFHASSDQMNLGMWGVIARQNHWLFQLGAFAIILMNALLLNTIFNRNEFMERNSYLVPFFYVVFMSFFHSFYFLEGLSIAQSFVVLMLYQLFKLNQNEDGRRATFNVGLFYGVACTFFPVLMLGFPFVFWMVWVMRPFVLRESMLIAAGFIVPILYSGVYSLFVKTRLDKTEFSSSSTELHWLNTLVLIVGVTLLVMLSLRGIYAKISASSIRMKKLFRLLLLFVVMSVLIVLIDFFLFHKVEPIGILLALIVLLLPYGFGEKKQKVLPSVLFYLIFFYSLTKFFIPFESITF